MTTKSWKKPAAALTVLVAAFATVPAGAAPRSRIPLPDGVKPTDTVELADGKKVSAQQFADELNQLQEAIERSNASLKKTDKKPFRGKERDATQEKDAKDQKAAFNSRVAKLRERQANGFKDLVRRRGQPKLPSNGPRLAGFDDESIQLGPSIGGPIQGPINPTKPTLPGQTNPNAQPVDEPLSLTYEEALGKKEQAAIFVAFGLENTGDRDSVGCEGAIETGAYLFNERLSLAKAVLKGSVNGTTASGGLELYLLGKMVDGFPKSGSMTLPELKKSINPPEVDFRYVWPPITIKIEAGVAGEFGMAFTNTQGRSSGNMKGTCTAGVVPYVRATGKASASVAAVVYKAGVDINLTLFDMKAPSTAKITLSDNPLAFKEDFDVTLDTKYLDGDLSFFVQTNIPRKGEKIWDVDWDTIYRKTLFAWDGFSDRDTLAHFSGKQTLFQ